MPTDIKKAAIALIISCVSALIGVYIDGIEVEGAGFSDPYTLGFNAVWALVIAWIIWDLLKGKSIKITLLLVGVIMLLSLAWDYIEFGFGISQIFYAIELIMFVLAYFWLSTRESKEWYAARSL